jgi:hypothetical protein
VPLPGKRPQRGGRHPLAPTQPETNPSRSQSHRPSAHPQQLQRVLLICPSVMPSIHKGGGRESRSGSLDVVDILEGELRFPLFLAQR